MRVKYLDVLKAFAIIAVVLYHAGFMKFGYLGVDLFLVINGYLITKSLYRKFLIPCQTEDAKLKMKSNIQGYVDFENKRVLRLLPPLLLAGAACMLAGYWVMLPDDYENLSQSVIATNFFGNNILAAITTRNYWDVVNEYKPLMHTWYVGIVMQFYIVYPLLFILAKYDKRNPKGILLTMIATLAVVSLLFYLGTNNDAERFYYLPSRFFEFAAGGLVALLYDSKESKPFRKVFVYASYLGLLIIIGCEAELMPPLVRLLAVVALSVVLLCSQKVLENRVTGNTLLAKIGAASYSIFIWHQILLAFCRYTWTNDFTWSVFAAVLLGTTVLSWLTYKYVEQGTVSALKTRSGAKALLVSSVIVFIVLNACSAYIYMNSGVVRDVPELFISKDNIHRGVHKEYNDKIYGLDKPFSTDKRHWLIIGNSFGRDFANTILESEIADSVELSYIYMDDFAKPEKGERYASADKIFLSSLGTNEDLVSRVESVCRANGFPTENLIIVGTKNFGESNGQFYIKRGSPDYYKQRTKLESHYYLEINNKLKAAYGDRYLDLISLVIDEKGTMPVFTPDHKFISQDCRHFSKGGAMYFSKLIDWKKYLK